MELLSVFIDNLNLRYNNLSKKTVKNYRADVAGFIKWYEEKFSTSLRLNSSLITLETLDLYKKAKILESNLSHRSFKRHLSSLRRFFKFLKYQGIILKDPFEIKSQLDTASAQHDKWHLQGFRNYLSLNNKSNLTIKNYILDVQHFLTWVEKIAGENIFSKIDQFLLNEYKQRLLKQAVSLRTINRNLSSLRKYLKWAAEEGHILNLELKKKTLESREEFPKQEAKPTREKSTTYSFFPPLRLIQKILKGIGFICEISIVAPLLKFTDTLSFTIAKVKGRPVFRKSSRFILGPRDKSSKLPTYSGGLKLTIENPQYKILNYSKAMYAPLSISTRYFPWHKKAWHHIRHSRPKWYKIYHSYSITRYFHLAFLILSMSILGFAIYQNIVDDKQKEKSVLSSFVASSPKILSFNGELTDNFNNPIGIASVPLRVGIYSDQIATGAALLWQEVISVNPDKNGSFSAFLGSNTPIPTSLFSQDQLWLGVSIADSPELTPRNQLPTVALARNAQALQGLPVITSQDAGTKNVILALDSSGNLTISGQANPTFQATGGTFRLLGETLLLSTTPGTNTNVEIAPMDLGKIDIQKPIFNSTENNNIDNSIGAVEIDDSLTVLATSSAEAAFTINQTSTGELISTYTNGVDKFKVDNNGNIISATGTKWQPFSDSTSALNVANATGNIFIAFDTVNSILRFLSDTTERGAVFYQNSDSAFHIRSASALALDTNNSNTPKVYIATSGNLGIGTISPLFRLDVQDSQAASAAAQIFNTNSSSDADGLVVKLGNTSTTAVDNANHFISFETSGNGIVGSVRGSGGRGIDFKTEGIADFAEYLKKDKNQNILYGSLICIDEKGLVLPCDNTYNKIIGVSSNQGGFTGGEDKKEESIRVGFVGQVYTRVVTTNGNIKPGDPLASSSTPGVAVKALNAGQIVGRAMEVLLCHPEEQSDEGSHGILRSAQNDNLCEGKVLVSIGVSWYDPNTLNEDLLKDTKASQENNLKDHISALIEEYIQQAKALVDPGSKIILPIAKMDQIHRDIISPLASDSTAHLEGGRMDSFEVKTPIDNNASTSAAVKPDLAEAKVSTSGAQVAQDNKILTYEDIKKDQKESPNINTFPQGLMAFGPTSLADTSITGRLSIGAPYGGLMFSDNSVNVLGTDLALQPLRQGGLSIMGDLVYIDTQGNLKVDGNAQFAKDVKVGGDIIASGSGTFNKLNLSLVQKAIAISQIEIIATGSAGLGAIQANQEELTIRNNIVTDKSLIYITPVGTPSGQTPFLMRQVPDKPGLSAVEGSFTVGLASPSASKTLFNWLIIN